MDGMSEDDLKNLPADVARDLMQMTGLNRVMDSASKVPLPQHGSSTNTGQLPPQWEAANREGERQALAAEAAKEAAIKARAKRPMRPAPIPPPSRMSQ